MTIHTYMVYWFIFCKTTLSNIYLYVCMYAVYMEYGIIIWNILGECLRSIGLNYYLEFSC